MKTLPIDNAQVTAALLAARFAAEIGLRPGNMWEPAVAPQIAADLTERSKHEVERDWRIRLGLPR